MNTELKKNGYKLLKKVFCDESVNSLISFTDRLIEFEKNNHYKQNFSDYYLNHRLDNGVLYDVYQRHPEFRKFAESNIILDEIGRILGNNFYLYVNSFLYKPPGRSNEVPWHQDFLNKPSESEKILAWVALDDATITNGCLKVIPGSHKQGFKDWYTKKGATHHDRLVEGTFNEEDKKYIEMSKGDVLLFSNYLIHGSDQNNSEFHRRAYRIVYKKIDTTYTPRGGPIVMRGNNPDTIDNSYNLYSLKNKSLKNLFLNIKDAISNLKKGVYR